MLLEIPVLLDFSFSETLSAHGWRRLLPFVWDEAEEVLERVEELPEGDVVLLRLRGVADRVQVEMQGGVDQVAEEEVMRRVRRMRSV